MSAVREDQHGTATGYQYGCRCDRCCEARATATGHRWAGECVSVTGEGKGRTSKCVLIATAITSDKGNVARLARLANRSAWHFAKYGDQLREAKGQLAETLRSRDEHMAECPAAQERFA